MPFLDSINEKHVTFALQVALYGVGRLLLPRPTLRGLWMGLLLLFGASRIIFPIIYAEGFRAVFMPWLAPKPAQGLRRTTSSAGM